MRTNHGARVLDGEVELSFIPARPVATGTMIDVLAASGVIFGAGPPLAVLGFAAGGVLAPIRALGYDAPVTAVDLSTRWLPLFREFASKWAGPFRFERAEASDWLRRRRAKFGAILDDLSERAPEAVQKPWVSVAVLPELMARRLRPGGVVVTNLLPWPEVSWRALIDCARKPFTTALIVRFEDYENRILIAGARLPEAAEASRRLRSALRRIGSDQATGFSVRTLRRA